MKGMTATYCSNGGYPRVIGMRPSENRMTYARPKATTASAASDATWNATRSRPYRLSMNERLDFGAHRPLEHRAIELERVLPYGIRVECGGHRARDAGGK